MNSLPCTSIAGRHALDAARARDRNLRRNLQDTAREKLAHALLQTGMEVYPHLDPELGPERSIWVSCRVVSRATDHRLVYAILDELKWAPDCQRLSRYAERFDIVRLRHQDTDATLALIIKLPFAQPEPLEAA